jgi:acetyl esterase/lipase
MMVALRDQGLPLPDGAILFSPWTDLTVSGASVEANAEKDVWGARALLEGWGRHCLGEIDPRDPRISPVFADLDGLPPLLFLAGEHEALLDDSRRVHERALAMGVASTLHVGPRMQHDWPLTLPWLAESRNAWRAVAAFVEKNVEGGRT